MASILPPGGAFYELPLAEESRLAVTIQRSLVQIQPERSRGEVESGIAASYWCCFSVARKPRRSTAAIICWTVTWAGSKATTASFALRLTSTRFTPFSPSRAFLTATGQAPHVIPSTARTTVEVAARPTSTAINRPSSRAMRDAQRFIAFPPCRGRREARRCSSHARAGRT
jgi:hypothetical protein